MSIEVVSSCPLGSKCEEAKDGKIHRCAWYTQLAGTDPGTGAQIDKWGCAMAWLPVLLVENSQQQRGTGAAIESFRNEVVFANKAALDAVAKRLEVDPVRRVERHQHHLDMPRFNHKSI